MSQLKPFEGADAEELVRRVRSELGPNARIVKGETHRSGGVLGFFSKEQLRVYAEVPDADEPPRAQSPIDLRQRPETAEQDEAVEPIEPARPVAPDVFAAIAEETADQNDITSTPPARPVAVAVTPLVTGPHPRQAVPPVAPSGPADFATVLRDVAAAVEEEPHPPGAAAEQEPAQPAADEEPPRPEAAAAPEPPQPGPVPTPAEQPEAASAPPGTHFRPEETSSRTPDAHGDRRSRRSHPGPSGDPLVVALRDAGLRRSEAVAVAVRHREGTDLSVVLTKLFTRLPPPPKLLPVGLGGRRLIIVGAAADADRFAVEMSEEADVGPDNVAYLDASSGDDCGGAVIIAVDAALSTPRLARLRRAITALCPATVIGIVDAAVKPADVSAWADGLGGLDALALVGVSVTQSPAAVLRIGIPVARLDGHPASPARWAATVADIVGTAR